MPEKRRRFDQEFREGAVRIVRETNRPIARVAADLGINPGTLGNWVNQDKVNRGSTNTSFRFTTRLADNGIHAIHGFRRRLLRQRVDGDFFSTLKIELVYRHSWRTRDEAENAIFSYIDGWYNPHRIQKHRGWCSPDEYEHTWRTTHHDQPQPTSVKPAPNRRQVTTLPEIGEPRRSSGSGD